MKRWAAGISFHLLPQNEKDYYNTETMRKKKQILALYTPRKQSTSPVISATKMQRRDAGYSHNREGLPKTQSNNSVMKTKYIWEETSTTCLASNYCLVFSLDLDIFVSVFSRVAVCLEIGKVLYQQPQELIFNRGQRNNAQKDSTIYQRSNLNLAL